MDPDARPYRKVKVFGVLDPDEPTGWIIASAVMLLLTRFADYTGYRHP